MPKSPSTSPEFVFAKKGGASEWGWRDPADALAKAWQRAEAIRVSRAVAAIGCGIVAWITKDIVGHGEFQPWAGAALGIKWESVSQLDDRLRTLRNYMAAGRAFLVAKNVKPAALKKSAFSRWALDRFAGDIAEDPIHKAMVAFIGERSLTDIYQDEGIIRERDSHQTHTASSKTAAEQVQLELAGILDSLATVNTNTTTLLSTGNWEKVPKEKRWEFVSNQIPALKAFALNTTWTPAERSALERELVTITTGLRSGGQGK